MGITIWSLQFQKLHVPLVLVILAGNTHSQHVWEKEQAWLPSHQWKECKQSNQNNKSECQAVNLIYNGHMLTHFHNLTHPIRGVMIKICYSLHTSCFSVTHVMHSFHHYSKRFQSLPNMYFFLGRSIPYISY